ncbi:mannose-1-phosphate guanylyltransferase / phosphomannomutase [hydrocarbon metagenome]|uniref:Mannose-1-phosphate guanylyltransferase / phosphomannomutase n=1 Tax=hydrocarbon metagenome TaxID=938273 RepID=A0A0W8E3P8_9ZZZZ
MKAMIMAAGVGSRLMPLTMHIPKPMVPVGNRPLMEHIVHLLGNHGCKQVIANLHYHSRIINEYFKDGARYGMSINYSLEDELMGTAGGVKKCDWFLNDTFVVISGDALTDLNITALLHAHRQNGALATIALKKVDEVEHFGIVITDENNKIKSFQEKPKSAEALSKTANTGIYIFEPEIFKYIPARQFYDFGKQVFPHLVKIGAPFYGVSINDYWCDVGNIDTYRRAHADLLAAEVRVRSSGRIICSSDQARVLTGKQVIIGDKVKFQGTVIIGDGCVIGSGVELHNSIIWNDSRIGDRCVINEGVVGSGCQLGSSVRMEAGAVVGSGCKLNDGDTISACSKVFNSTAGELQSEHGQIG